MSIYVTYYIIIFILSIILTKYVFYPSFSKEKYLDSKKRMEKQRTLFVVIAVVLLVCILGFRSENNGLDLHNLSGTGYFFYYEKINEDSFIEILKNFFTKKYANFEIGFCLFCKFVGTICSNHQIMLFSSALVSVLPVGYYIHKNSKNAWLSLMVYLAMPFFGAAYFSAIRQGIAIGLVILSYEFIKKKKLMWFIGIILLACSFHSTAIVALAAYPVYQFRMDQKSSLYGGLGVLTAVFLLKEPLFIILSRILAEDAEIIRNNSINFLLVLIIIYVICVLFVKKNDLYMRGMTNIFWLACVAQAFSGVNNLAGRVAWYFLPALIVLLPNLIIDMRIKEKVFLKPLVYMLGVLLCMLGLYFFRYDMVAMSYPYEFFWTVV